MFLCACANGSSRLGCTANLTMHNMQVTPSWGWILAYEYTFLFFFLFYGKCLHFFSVAGRANGHSLNLNRVCLSLLQHHAFWQTSVSVKDVFHADCLVQV